MRAASGSSATSALAARPQEAAEQQAHGAAADDRAAPGGQRRRGAHHAGQRLHQRAVRVRHLVRQRQHGGRDVRLGRDQPLGEPARAAGRTPRTRGTSSRGRDRQRAQAPQPTWWATVTRVPAGSAPSSTSRRPRGPAPRPARRCRRRASRRPSRRARPRGRRPAPRPREAEVRARCASTAPVVAARRQRASSPRRGTASVAARRVGAGVRDPSGGGGAPPSPRRPSRGSCRSSPPAVFGFSTAM